MNKQHERDIIQDEMIKRNAEHIRRNEEAIRRQTECLEKIRDHYFPKKTMRKRTVGFILKVVGVVTVYAGFMETADWYMNTRQAAAMAEKSAAVAKRLFIRESDSAGAVKFLEKAVELDDDKVEYRLALAYVRGIDSVAEFFDLGRPLLPAERERVDLLLSEAEFLEESAPDEAMPHVLAAHALVLRGEREAAIAAVNRAVAMAPDKVVVRINACGVHFINGDFAVAREHLAAVERLDSTVPFIAYWKGMLALAVDHDLATARSFADQLVRSVPRSDLAYAFMGRALMAGDKPDYAAARAAFERAVQITPTWKLGMLNIAETYEREGNPIMARLWLDHIIRQDANWIKALIARARLSSAAGEWRNAVDDLTAAIELSPFSADLYRARADVRKNVGDSDGAAADLKIANAIGKHR